MLFDEERAKATDPRKVGGRRAPDEGGCLGVCWHHTRITFFMIYNSLLSHFLPKTSLATPTAVTQRIA
jgi:hypothetical protein